MSNQIIVPSLGESVTEATVSKWLKQVGETVSSDEPLVELETDKVNIEVPSPLSGVLSSINVKEGSTVEVGSLLGSIKEETTSTTSNNTSSNEEESYVPPKTIQKKNIQKQPSKKIKKITKDKQKSLKLVKDIEEENSALVLDTLVDQPAEEEISTPIEMEEKYIPPKTRKNLSPAVRKIVEERNIDI